MQAMLYNKQNSTPLQEILLNLKQNQNSSGSFNCVIKAKSENNYNQTI